MVLGRQPMGPTHYVASYLQPGHEVRHLVAVERDKWGVWWCFRTSDGHPGTKLPNKQTAWVPDALIWGERCFEKRTLDTRGSGLDSIAFGLA